MKTIVGLLLAASCLCPARAAEDWAQAVEGSRVSLQVEKALFELKGNPNFFIHVRLVNHGKLTMGIDLRNKGLVACPYRWSASDVDHRAETDKFTMGRKLFDKATIIGLKGAYWNKELTLVPPKKSTDYYADFNAGGRKEIDAMKADFILVSIKGQMQMTDGQTISSVDANYELALNTPVRWETVPRGATVILH